MLNKSVAIIGAGLSAAVCAKSLSGLVKNISVFEQSECVGGRLRLSDEISTTPSFTVSTPFFQKIIDRWMLDGVVSETTPWNVEISSGEINSLMNTQTQYTVKPNMVGLVDYLLSGLNVHLNTEVADIEKKGDQWRLFDFEGGYLGKFDCVIFSTAAPSIHNLIQASDVLFSKMTKIDYSSAWSVVISLSENPKLGFDQATFIESSLSSCFSVKNNKMVLLATPEWSEQYSALPAQQVANQLSDEFCHLTDLDKNIVVNSDAKFWSTKAAINTFSEDCIFDDETGFGACGDWCVAPRVECAILSGFSISDRVMKYFS